MDITGITSTIFTQASSSEQVGAIAAGAKGLMQAMFPYWGTIAAIALLPVLVGVIFYFLRPAKKHEITPGADGAPVRQRDIELEAAVMWNESETKARRDFAMRE